MFYLQKHAALGAKPLHILTLASIQVMLLRYEFVGEKGVMHPFFVFMVSLIYTEGV